jgi:hypothetical protein
MSSRMMNTVLGISPSYRGGQRFRGWVSSKCTFERELGRAVSGRTGISMPTSLRTHEEQCPSAFSAKPWQQCASDIQGAMEVRLESMLHFLLSSFTQPTTSLAITE